VAATQVSSGRSAGACEFACWQATNWLSTRSRVPLAFTDFQDHRFGPVSFIRLRKTFG